MRNYYSRVYNNGASKVASIPKDIAAYLEVSAGDVVTFVVENGKVEIKKAQIGAKQ